MLSGPNHVFEFVCQQTGRCCRSRWKVELSHYDKVNLEARARGSEVEEAVRVGVIEDEPEPGGDGEGGAEAEAYRRTYHLAKSACGGCGFLDGNRCSLHAALGPEALPEPCRNFPVIAVQTGWGVEVGYNLTCPHAIALTAKRPFAVERRDDWERPLDPQQSRASFIPPPGGWAGWRARRAGAIGALDGVGDGAGLVAAVGAAMQKVAGGAWGGEVERWCDALELRDRIEVSYAECAPFLKTWGEALERAPEWGSVAEGLAVAERCGGVGLVGRYLQHTLHTVYFRTGQPEGVAYLWALAAFGAVLRLLPAMEASYPKAPVEAAIVLVEMGVFGDLRTLGEVMLPAPPSSTA